MKKGFTLVELLIVMVIVGILVTVALPKYYAAMEHGRSMEGITNLKAASEVLNARYVMNGNMYRCSGAANKTSGRFVVAGASTGNFTRPTYFGEPILRVTGTTGWSNCDSSNGGTVYIDIVRNGPEPYTLTAVNQAGELKYITCVAGTGAAANICENVGAELVGEEYRITYGN